MIQSEVSEDIDSLRKSVCKMLTAAPRRPVTPTCAQQLPKKTAGIYCFFDAEGRIRYIGAAGDLKARIGSHLRLDTMWLHSQKSNLAFLVLQDHWNDHLARRRRRKFETMAEWMRFSKDLARIFRNRVSGYTFAIIPCRAEDRYVIEALALSGLPSLYNGRGVA